MTDDFSRISSVSFPRAFIIFPNDSSIPRLREEAGVGRAIRSSLCDISNYRGGLCGNGATLIRGLYCNGY